MNSGDYERIILYPTNANDAARIAAFAAEPGTTVMDTLAGQLEELYKIRHPETVRSGADSSAVEAFAKAIRSESGSPDRFGTWVWYPWRKLLIRFLPEALHTELRTARNRNLITENEQERFYRSRIGVAGLSVGNSVVAAIVHTGGAKHLSVADFDTLSGSNTNRIRAGFDSVDLSKTTVMLRETYLTNPYADIRVYDGLTEDRIEAFLTTPGKLDAVVDEMDDLYLKIRLRVAARRLGIPVVMAADNGDGAVVDIERFDLDPNRPLMHGDIPERELLAIPASVPRPVAAKIISTWVGPDNIAERMMGSLMEIGKTLYTWPQLGTAATIAGALVAFAVRKIVTGGDIGQGKFIVSPESLLDPAYASASRTKQRAKTKTAFLKTLGIGP